MKNTLLILSILFLCSSKSFCQIDTTGEPGLGQVKFFGGSWPELLSQAKSQNKPFFVDTFTEWCGPCKLMSKFTFTDLQVANYANANFLAYQIDAEKGEGIKIAEQYKVRAYPTVLFFDSTGKLIGKVVGYYDNERFLGAMDKYLKKMTK